MKQLKVSCNKFDKYGHKSVYYSGGKMPKLKDSRFKGKLLFCEIIGHKKEYYLKLKANKAGQKGNLVQGTSDEEYNCRN